MLADAAGEDKGVDFAPEGDVISAHEGADAVDE